MDSHLTYATCGGGGGDVINRRRRKGKKNNGAVLMGRREREAIKGQQGREEGVERWRYLEVGLGWDSTIGSLYNVTASQA